MVRGTTAAGIVGKLRAAGAAEVHLRLTAPPFLAPCYYGTDIPDDRQLIAAHHTLEEVRDILGCDSLGYLPRACLGQLFGPRAPGGILRSLFWRGLRRRHTPGHRKKTALSASGRKEKERMIEMETKYVFVTGGVISGLGKGITAASLGRLLKNRGYKVAAQKLDPYLNIDPGTMSPYQHGEVFVTEDGAEADLDLGHYERFIDENLNRFSNLTTGKVYWTLLNKERRGDYLGSTVQVIPHVTDEIKTFLYAVGRAAGADVVITEVGGTVGDIKASPSGGHPPSGRRGGPPKPCLSPCDPPVLRPPRSGRLKTKPTQHSVKELQSAGIAPDLIILRSDGPVEEAVREKDRPLLQRKEGLRHPPTAAWRSSTRPR